MEEVKLTSLVRSSGCNAKLPPGDLHIAMDNLAELAVNAFEADLITYEKLEYLLWLCGLKPGDIGITKMSGRVFPSDEELDSVMEE